MRCLSLVFVGGFSLGIAAQAGLALAQGPVSSINRPVPGMRQAEIHNPSSPRYVDMQPGGYARRSAGQPSAPEIDSPSGGGTGHDHHHHHQGGFYSSPWGGYWRGYGYPYGGYGGYAYAPWSYSPWYGYGGPYAYLPPVVAPAEMIYGPQAARRFIGLDQPFAQPADVPAVVNARRADGFGELARDQPAQAERPKARVGNEETQARARRLISLGDESFSHQRYADAYQRYRSSVQLAPDVADGYLRQGFVQIALGRYSAAWQSIRRGLEIAPHWAASTFRLDAIYGDNQLVRAAHREALAQASAAAPHDAELLLLVGISLYFDGEADRARPFFERARQLGADDRHVAGFLKQLAPPVAQPQPAVGVEL